MQQKAAHESKPVRRKHQNHSRQNSRRNNRGEVSEYISYLPTNLILERDEPNHFILRDEGELIASLWAN